MPRPVCLLPSDQNYPSEDYSAEDALQRYYGDNLCRLVAAKQHYDPNNAFQPLQGVPLEAPGCDAKGSS